MRAIISVLLVGTVCSMVVSSAAQYNVPRDEIARPFTFRPRPTGIPADRPSTSPPVRKGEYICGHNRVCKLQPGVVPKGCNGMCQYPLGPPGPPVSPAQPTQ